MDEHVRVYHGHKTKLPRKYVSRQRLCLRGTTDYWVNDLIGRPFFVIDKVVDSGLLAALREEIVPRLLADVPHQPSDEELAANPHACRMVLVFDREGYSPGFMKEMWQCHRIGCITYHKHPAAPWPEAEFSTRNIELSNGETPHHMTWAELPEPERFTKPVMERKRLMDAVRMIAYRAETALCALLRPLGMQSTEARRLLQDLFVTEADIQPDASTGLLEVHVHRGSRPAVDRMLEALFEQLNEMAFTFPGTKLTLHYRLVGPTPPANPSASTNGVTDSSQR